MNKVLKLGLALITGLLAIFALNGSPLSKHSFGIELSFGWSEGLVSDGPCNAIYISPEGLPFKDWRSAGCGTEINNLATIANYVTGLSISVAAYIIARKYLAKRSN